ncbi:MAG: hypothetical protein R3191_03690, partial [Anaerolineales bacterium]|nr:hypothetical protein [Anaerolineales bacterium]
MRELKEFHGPNAAYVQALYDRYLQDPESVDPQTREAFRTWDGRELGLGELSPQDIARAVGAANFAQSIRSYGYLAAQLDPLGSDSVGDPTLT